MKYTRIYTGADGDTHLEDVNMEISPRVFSEGAAPVCLSDPWKASGVFFLAAGLETKELGFYNSPQKMMGLLMAGDCIQETSDGDRRMFKPGDVILYEDNTGLGHKSNNSVGVIFAMVPLKE
ncbi:MAG: hypothetical protein ACYC2T_02640 [Bacillota bacterium]